MKQELVSFTITNADRALVGTFPIRMTIVHIAVLCVNIFQFTIQESMDYIYKKFNIFACKGYVFFLLRIINALKKFPNIKSISVSFRNILILQKTPRILYYNRKERIAIL